jgi:hypothetical protein
MQVYDRADLLYDGMQPGGSINAAPSSRYGSVNYGSLRRPPRQSSSTDLPQQDNNRRTFKKPPVDQDELGDDDDYKKWSRQHQSVMALIVVNRILLPRRCDVGSCY